MKEKVKSILDKDGVIILDTNVYLNIYDRSPEYSNFSLTILKFIEDKIWIPSTVKREFYKNHRRCFERQKKKIDNACKELKSQLDSTKRKIENQCMTIKTFEFPDIDDIQTKIFACIDEAVAAVDEYSEEHEILDIINKVNMQKDNICDYVDNLIENKRVMEELSVTDVYSMAQDAEKRYSKKVPPGFKDEKKNDGLEKYGDYFVWEETLRFAEKMNVPVVFVTDDVKLDWYERDREKFKFHSLLCEEFESKVNTEFVGMNSRTLYGIVADLFGIEKPDALVCAMQFTSEDYIEELIHNDVIYECIGTIAYFGEDYVNMDSLSASATEGLEVSENIEILNRTYNSNYCCSDYRFFFYTSPLSIGVCIFFILIYIRTLV